MAKRVWEKISARKKSASMLLGSIHEDERLPAGPLGAWSAENQAGFQGGNVEENIEVMMSPRFEGRNMSILAPRTGDISAVYGTDLSGFIIDDYVNLSTSQRVAMLHALMSGLDKDEKRVRDVFAFAQSDRQRLQNEAMDLLGVLEKEQINLQDNLTQLGECETIHRRLFDESSKRHEQMKDWQRKRQQRRERKRQKAKRFSRHTLASVQDTSCFETSRGSLLGLMASAKKNWRKSLSLSTSLQVAGQNDVLKAAPTTHRRSFSYTDARDSESDSVSESLSESDHEGDGVMKRSDLISYSQYTISVDDATTIPVVPESPPTVSEKPSKVSNDVGFDNLLQASKDLRRESFDSLNDCMGAL
jgi:hypothetical protein